MPPVFRGHRRHRRAKRLESKAWMSRERQLILWRRSCSFGLINFSVPQDRSLESSGYRSLAISCIPSYVARSLFFVTLCPPLRNNGRTLANILVLTDNEAVAASEFWHQLLARWRPGSRLAWVPSHGKRPGWTPPSGYPSTALCRAMSAAADSTAKQLAQEHGMGYVTQAAERRRTVEWCTLAVERQNMVTRPWWELCLPHFVSQGENWQQRN